nr:vacuolar protein sorting-associated protein 51 like [Quercus suber]
MSTIASPRPSIALSSRRNSASTDNTIRSASTSRPPASLAGSAPRRNRTALRDYYNLQSGAASDTPEAAAATAPAVEEPINELDAAEFEAETYVQTLLTREGLEGVLRVQSGLASAIRSLDGEKKALVYDNYSRLIAATDTIRSMREKMDPLTPGTSELVGQIGRITEMAEGLAGRMRLLNGRGEGGKEQAQRNTVRWVLDAPRRIMFWSALREHSCHQRRARQTTPQLANSWQAITFPNSGNWHGCAEQDVLVYTAMIDESQAEPKVPLGSSLSDQDRKMRRSACNVRWKISLLARFIVPKIKYEDCLVNILRLAPVMQEKIGWRCRTWLANTLRVIAQDARMLLLRCCWVGVRLSPWRRKYIDEEKARSWYNAHDKTRQLWI